MDVFQSFLHTCAEYPNAIAVDDQDIKYTFDELKTYAQKLATLMVRKSDRPKVIIAAEKGILAYAAIMATLGLNGCFCPINAELPEERVSLIAQQVEPDVVVADGTIAEKLGRDFPDALIINTMPDDLSELKKIFCEADYDSECYIIFTSGSTGNPKGVVVTRRSISKFVDSFNPIIGVGEGDRWAQYSSLGFDLSLVDIFCSFATASCLVPIKKSHHRLFPNRAIRECGITIWHSVPSVIELCTSTNSLSQGDLDSLRIISFCGETLNFPVIEQLRSVNPELRVLNTYGPTEGTAFCTVYEVPLNSSVFDHSTSVPIGKAINGWNVEIVEEGTSETGEILIHGAYLAKGYLGEMDDRNAFVRTGEGYQSFRTGDFARKDSRGNLIFSGRQDRQVKISGNRFELGEIDSALQNRLKQPVRTILIDRVVICAVEGEETLSPDALRMEINRLIPSFALPSKFLYFSEFPRNSNSKVDMKKLEEILKSRYDDVKN